MLGLDTIQIEQLPYVAFKKCILVIFTPGMDVDGMELFVLNKEKLYKKLKKMFTCTDGETIEHFLTRVNDEHSFGYVYTIETPMITIYKLK